MQNKYPYQIVLIASLILSGCTPKPLVTEISSETSSYDEIIHIKNCGNKADSVQTASHSFSTKIEGTGTVKAGYQVIEGSVSATYGQYRSITKSQTLTAAPETNMEFTLRWSEDVRAGNVTVGGESTNYTVHIPVSVEQISSRDLGCNSNNIPDSNTYFLDNFDLGTDFKQDYWSKQEDYSCNAELKNSQAEFNLTGLNPLGASCRLSANEVFYEEVGSMEAKFSTSNGATGDFSIGIIEFTKGTFAEGAQNWIIQCGIVQTPNADTVELFFNVHSTYPQGDPETYIVIPASTERWYTMKLEIIPDTDKVICYADGKIIGSYEGKNLVALHNEKLNRQLLSYWSPNSQAVYYVDNVKLFPPQ